MSEKSILKSFTISVIFCAALFTSCDLFFNNKKKDNFTDDVPPARVESEHNFEIQITLNPRILEHGAIPFETSEYNSSDSSQAISNLSSRSAAFVPEGTISNLSITATRKKDGNGASIDTENQTTEAGNKITGTGNATNQSFALKINKTGTWLIEVSFNIDGTTYSGKEVIKLTTETSYKVGLAIFAYAQDLSLSTNAFGTVKLVTEYEENLTADTPSLLPQAAQIKLKKRNGTDGTEESNSYLINGIINSTERTVTFQKQIPSGIYFAEIAFFSDVERLSPLYTCKETLLIADNKTTDTWVISSSYLEQDGEDSSSIIKNEKDGPLQVVDGQVHFIITSELVKAFVQKYDGPEFYVDADNGSDYNKGTKDYPFATVQKAVDTIIGTTSVPGVNDRHSQYTILLKSDVVEDQNAASYESGRKYSYVKIIGNGTSASETQIKITSDSEALAAYNSLYLIEKEGFSIDANRDNSHRGAVIWAQKVMLSLENVTVRGGYYGSYTSTPCAAGIHLTGAAKLTMEKNACIENNTQVRDTDPKKTGAGVYVASNCTFVMNGGVIRNNVNLMDQEHSAGGVLVVQNAEFIMNPLKDDNGNEITCAIYGNRGMAGAITVFSSGVFTMNGGVIGKPSSQVTQAADASHWGNKAEIIGSTGGKGGAILLLADTNGAPKVYLNGGEICYNYAEKEGGAIACLDGNASHLVELNGTNICYNSAGSPDSGTGKGGAIYAESAVINMYKGHFYGNKVGWCGGAFYIEAGSDFDTATEKLNLNVYGGRISNNIVMNSVASSGSALGGGIYLGNRAQCQINSGTIDQNKTYGSYNSLGGGIYVSTSGDGISVLPTITINGGVINANECGAAVSTTTALGSAIYADSTTYCIINNSNVVMENNDVHYENDSNSGNTKCIVTFDTTTNWPGNTNKVSPQIITAGGTVTAPSLSDPTPIAAGEQKHGTFLGWYTKPIPQQNPASGSSTPIDSPFVFAGNTNATEVNSNITLYAVWDFVYVPSATFEGKSTLCSGSSDKVSAVFMQDRVLPIGNLWVCDHEVTQGEYSTYCKYSGTGPDSSWGRGNNYPAYYVSWYDALVYCNLRSKTEGLTPVYKIKKNGGAAGELTTDPARWVSITTSGAGDTLRYGGPYENNSDWNAVVCDWDANGYRLPTEAEWEYIARGGNGLSGTQYVYSGSDDIDKVAWNPVGNGNNTTHEVRKKQANSLGLYDMSGNVWEWCWDLRNTLDSNTPAIGPDVSSQDPPERIRRGGSSKSPDTVNYCRVNYRTSGTHNLYIPNLGFRVVRNADGSAPYEPPKYTVTFDTTTNWSGSSLTIEPVQVYDGKKVSRPSGSPADNSVNFRGWFTKPNPSTSDTAFNFSTTAITRDLTLYAVDDFVYVAGGTVVGSDDYNQSNGQGGNASKSGAFTAGRTVTLSSFYISNHELTQSEYEAYCCYTQNAPDSGIGKGTDYPAYNVSWYDAIVYCNLRSEAEGLTPCYALGGETDPRNWTGTKNSSGKYSCSYESSNSTWDSITCDITASGYRLPTEAEWEYAARGGHVTNTTPAFANYFSGAATTNYTSSTNNELATVGWYKNNSGDSLKRVKTKAPNELGIYDMSGNVYELCWDWKGDPIGTGSVTDPYGPLSGTYRVRRGGSYHNVAYECSVYYRFACEPYSRGNLLGFRVVRSAGLSNPSVQAKCTVTYDTKTNWPGSSLTIEPVKVNAGKKIKQPSQTPNAPVHFRGWFTKANPSATDTPFNFNTTAITRDLTLYAVWDFVYVEGGTVVGSDDYNQNRNSGNPYIGAFPAGRSVTLSSFYISDHELTQGEYETYCCYTSNTDKPNSEEGLGANYPAYYVSWYDAIVYCNLRSMAEGLTPCYSLSDETDPKKWTGIKSSNGKYSSSYTSPNETWNSITCDITASGYRLPTEAEWEYAARGGQETYGTTAFANYFAGATTTNYSASSNSDLDSVGWYNYNICNNGVTGSEGSSGAAGYGTHEVKKKAPNALGLYDMSGNVYEWCWDWKGSISTSETVTDPRGASSGSDRLLRGGSWCQYANYCSVSYRNNNAPNIRNNHYGFRLVRSAQ